MPATQSTTGKPPAELPRSGIVESRIDAPHVLGDGPPPPSVAPTADHVSGDEPADIETLALVQVQAQQLSRHLREQAQDLDAREARLQAQMAQFDNEVRSARLVLTQQRQTLDEQASELESQRKKLEEQQKNSPQAQNPPAKK